MAGSQNKLLFALAIFAALIAVVTVVTMPEDSQVCPYLEHITSPSPSPSQPTSSSDFDSPIPSGHPALSGLSEQDCPHLSLKKQQQQHLKLQQEKTGNTGQDETGMNDFDEDEQEETDKTSLE